VEKLAPRARLGTDVTRSLATPMVGRQIDLGILTGGGSQNGCSRSAA
jgi:hypothetical protein